MPERNFMELLRARWAEGKFVCVGLDSDHTKLPESARGGPTPELKQVEFNARIIDATRDLVCAYKPNMAFYEALGDAGVVALQDTIDHVRVVAPEIPVILDYKRGDIGNTNIGYVEAAFSIFDADAATVSPYLGMVAMKPFLDMGNKGIIVLARTSNEGADEFQDAMLDLGSLRRRGDG
jgi:orotidine-5'-phosphate decarboxylase